MDSTWLMVLVTLVGLATGQAPHGLDRSVCVPSTDNTVVQKPSISEQYQCTVEIVMKNKNKTDLMVEYVDAVNNRAFVSQEDLSIKLDAWFNYDTNEIIMFYPQAGPASDRCSVQELSNSSQRFLFGFSSSGISAASAIHFSGKGVNEIYKGRTTVRGIQVEHWYSCEYWKDLDATMNVNWYFSAKDVWTSSFGPQVPVQAHVSGVSYLRGKHNFEHIYNFYHFKPFLRADDNTIFETPSGVVCPGRKLTKSLPVLPNTYFSQKLETIDESNMMMTHLKEAFDFRYKLVMYEYRPGVALDSPYGNRDLIEIHDFNTGVAYVKDKEYGNCSIVPIEAVSFDVKKVDPHTVRMRTAREFFYLDTPSVSYEGVKLYRHVECDTWVGTRTDWPPGFSGNSTWEWRFATADWIEDNDSPLDGHIPIYVGFSLPSNNLVYKYNTYDVKKNPLDLLEFDISPCYQFKPRRKFRVGFNAVSDTYMRALQTTVGLLKLSILQAVISTAQVSPLRVANVKIELSTIVTAKFELLDVAPPVGDTGTANREVSLEVAANSLLSQIRNGQFTVKVEKPELENLILVADPNKVVEVTYTKVSTTTSTSTTPSTTSSTKTSTTPSSLPPSASVTTSTASNTKTSTTPSSLPSPSSAFVTTSGSITKSAKTSSILKSSISTPASRKPSASLPSTNISTSASATSTSQQNPVSGKSTKSSTPSTRKAPGPGTQGYGKQPADTTTRTLSIVSVVIGTVIAAILAILLVVYLKKSGRIRVPGQTNSEGFDNVAFNSTSGQVNLQTDS